MVGGGGIAPREEKHERLKVEALELGIQKNISLENNVLAFNNDRLCRVKRKCA